MVEIIILGTGKLASEFIDIIYNDNRFDLKGIILDNKSHKNDKENIIEQSIKRGINLIELENLSEVRHDLVFAVEYNQFVPNNFTNASLIINTHMGILPKYRGFSANAFAIMNGETQIGYSLHAMNGNFDDGELFVVNRFEIGQDEIYSHVREKIISHMHKNIPTYLFNITSGILSGYTQVVNDGVVYGVKLNSSMGNISGFRNSTLFFLRLHQVFSPPHSQGLYFYFKNKKFVIYEMENGVEYGVASYPGFNGKIVNILKNIIFVKTIDSTIAITKLIEAESKREVDPKDFFKIGNQL